MITLRTRFRKAIPDPPAARRKVVVALGGDAPLRQRGALDALAGLARDHDVVVLEAGELDGRPPGAGARGSRLPGREIVTVLTRSPPVAASPGRVRSSSCPRSELLVQAGVLVVCAARRAAAIDLISPASSSPAGPRRRRLPAAHRRAGRSARVGHAGGPHDPPGDAAGVARARVRRRVDGAEGRGRLPLRRARPAAPRRSAQCTTRRRSSQETPARSSAVTSTSRPSHPGCSSAGMVAR